MRIVAEREAEKWLPLLLDDVERGEAITITRDGHPIASLTPVTDESAQTLRQIHTPEEVHAAMHRIRERAKLAGMNFNWSEIKTWRDEGRA
jgi:antitoxin (DNA-binding transcriptional repressor) of toxin-antitoxin stability system